MENHIIHIRNRNDWAPVQITGRVSDYQVEVFLHGRTEWVPKDLVEPKHLSRIPRKSADLLEEEQGIFWIPDEISILCVEDRLEWLTKRVWRRLPVYERRVLSEMLTKITDIGSEVSKYRYVFSPPSDGDHKEQFVEGCPAQIAEDLSQWVILNEAKELKSESARMFVIAREFAKIVLRQPQLFAVAGSALAESSEYPEARSHYADYLMDRVDWGADHATLIAWSWGFKEEYQAYLEAKPNRRRKRWFTEMSSAQGS